MNLVLSQAVQSLQNLSASVKSTAPELTNEFNHLVQVGSGLAGGNPSASQISAYANAVQNFGTVLNASDDSLKLQIIAVAESIVYSINAGNPVSPLIPGNPSNPLVPYQTPCSPGGSCSNVPAAGVYWTGLLILGCMIGAAVMVSKVRA
jgi:hypothetical protein